MLQKMTCRFKDLFFSIKKRKEIMIVSFPFFNFDAITKL